MKFHLWDLFGFRNFQQTKHLKTTCELKEYKASSVLFWAIFPRFFWSSWRQMRCSEGWCNNSFADWLFANVTKKAPVMPQGPLQEEEQQFLIELLHNRCWRPKFIVPRSKHTEQNQAGYFAQNGLKVVKTKQPLWHHSPWAVAFSLPFREDISCSLRWNKVFLELNLDLFASRI